jgi:hypothetical protein
MLLVCPFGFSVVVVFEVDWAKAAPLMARQSPSVLAVSLDVRMKIPSGSFGWSHQAPDSTEIGRPEAETSS